MSVCALGETAPPASAHPAGRRARPDPPTGTAFARRGRVTRRRRAAAHALRAPAATP